jgi:hypothetical protein
VGEAAKVADLGQQPERGDQADAPERAQPTHRVRPGLARRHLLELVVECGELGVDGVEVAEHVGERTLGERIVERLTPDPGLVSLGPGLLALAVDAAVAQQLLGQLVAGGGPRPAQVIAAADQIPQPLLLGGGRLDERQLAGAIETHELLGVATVGLDPVTGPDGHKRRRDHVAGDADPPKQPERS